MFPLKNKRNLLHFYIPMHLNKVETTYLGSTEDMKLYRCWVEDYEVNESRHSRSVSHIREAEGSYGYKSTPRLDQQQGNGNGRGGNGAIPKPKPKPKAKKEKSEDQLSRAVDWPKYVFVFVNFVSPVNSPMHGVEFGPNLVDIVIHYGSYI